MTKECKTQGESERGIALITALLATTILLALGMAVVFSATTDMVTTKTQRVGQQAFFAADGGIGVARRALAQSFSETMAQLKAGTLAFKQPYYAGMPTNGGFPAVQVLRNTTDTTGIAFYQGIIDRAVQLATASARAYRMDALNGSSFTVRYSAISGPPPQLIVANQFNATESATFRYSIEVTGATGAGGSARVHEAGRLSVDMTLVAAGEPGGRDFKFSGFGAFFDHGDTNAAAPLASGTFSGPVHTNTHFAFLSSRSVTFRNIVSSVDNGIRYDNLSNTSTNRAIPSAPGIAGITVSPEGYRQTSAVPLPVDAFSQEYAVINNTGIRDIDAATGQPVDRPAVIPVDGSGNPVAVFDAQGRVTPAVLAANLRNIANAAPTLSGGAIPNGVYVSSSNGSTIAGAGIYVKGDVTDMQLYADTNGDQVYVIVQGVTTTTVRTSYTNGTTTMSSGSTTRSYSGVFLDKSDPSDIHNGASLYVAGSISSLRGGKTSTTDRPAIAAQTRLTITSQRHINVTGDIKYANPVANSDGTDVANLSTLKNVLGIYTNDGNVGLAPNPLYVTGPGLGLEINGAVVTFNSNTANDVGIEGSITYTGGTGTGSNDRWRLVGSRVQAKINNIGYTYRDIYFDKRFAGGRFAPPFFPGTTYALAPPPVAGSPTITFVNAPAPTAMSWFRDNN
jgi:type IV pilus assembly PilX-like protein